LPFLSGLNESRSGRDPTQRTLAGESPCPVFRAVFCIALYAAGSSSCARRRRFTRIPAGVGTHRWVAVDPVRHCAHRTCADPLVVKGAPRSGEARSIGLVAFGTYWHGLWGRMVGLY